MEQRMAAERDPREVYNTLMREQPSLHGRRTEERYEVAVFNWALQPAVLEWISRHARPGLRTLETGCGYSTILFAAGGCVHDAVSPFAEEHTCINDWCRDHGVSTAGVTYHAGASQRILPAMPPAPLDLILIDGDHAVPAPFIDYYYTADRLVRGGLMLVDDTQLRSVQQLCEFLNDERGRWEVVEQVVRTRIYRKLVDGRVAEGVHFRQQPFVTKPLEPSPLSRVRRLVKRAGRRIKRAFNS
jgi:predicted O-methyltransferase YrrM